MLLNAISKVGSDRSAILRFLVSLSTFIIMACNIAFIHSGVLGIITLITSSIISAPAICSILMRSNIHTLQDYVIGSFVLLSVASIIIAPFAIFSNFNYIDIELLVIGLGLAISIINAKALLRNKYQIKSHAIKVSIRSLIIYAFFLLLCIITFIILIEGRSDSYSWMWYSKIPTNYIYSIFLVGGILLAIIIYGRSTSKSKLLLLSAFAFLIESYAAATVATITGSDGWYMIGEIRGSIYEQQDLSKILSDHITIGQFSFPSALITGWARGYANGLAIFLTSATQIDIYNLFPWITPIITSIFGPFLLYRIGKIASPDYRYGLILAFTLFLLYNTVFRDAITTKLSLSFPMLLFNLFLWSKYIRQPSRRNMYFCLAATAVSILSYSLFFVVSMEILIMSLFITRSQRISAVSNRIAKVAKWAIILSISVAFILIVPLLDTLQESWFVVKEFDFLKLRTSIINWFIDNSGINGPTLGETKEVFPASFLMLNNQGWFIATMALWSLTLLGILNNKKMHRGLFHMFVWLFLVSHISYFIALNFMQGVHATGGYLTTIMELSRMPLIALGILFLINIEETFRSKLRQLISNDSVQNYDGNLKHLFFPKFVMQMIYTKIELKITNDRISRRSIFNFNSLTLARLISVAIVLSLSFLIVQSETVETKATNITQGEVDAVKYLTGISKGDDYAVITDFNTASALYAFSNGNIFGGGFKAIEIPGVEHNVRTVYYLYALTQTSSIPAVMKQAAEESGKCQLYVIIPSYFGLDQRGVQRFEDNFGPFLSFGNNGKTILFQYNACK